MPTAALFVLVKILKQSKYPSMGEWLNKLWYISTQQNKTKNPQMVDT